MKYIKTKLNDVFIIEPEPFIDNRGLFRRTFCKNEFKETKIDYDIKQINISENIKPLTLRGFHFQNEPYGEEKVISCLRGEIYDIVLDLRKDSDSYLRWQAFNLSGKNKKLIYLPKGCANAYMTLKEDTWIQYFHSEFYSPGNEGGIRYDDPFFKFDWPSEPKIISEKDLNFPSFSIDSN